MKKNLVLSAAALVALAGVSASAQIAFTAGNLVVLQAGVDGGPALSNAAAALFLKEIDIADGHVVQSIPVSSTGATACTQSGSATSEGFLTRSVDGKRLVFVGYRADAGLAAVVSTTAANNPRVVAVADCNGAVDTSTALSDAYSANNIRSAVSTNGTDLWTAGTASGTGGGIRYTTLGGTTSVFLNDNGAGGSNPPTNCRVANIFFNQLYTSSSSGTFIGVGTVGTGLPTTGGQILTLLPGKSTVTGPSNYDYYFADASTLYLTDDRVLASGGGLQKWTFDGTTWTLQYTLNSGLANGLRHITGKTVAGSTTVWGTTGVGTAAAGNQLVLVTDTGASSTFATLGAGTGPNTWWRGIDFVPTGCTPGNTCYPNCDLSTSNPLLTANDFQCFLNEFAAGSSYANCDGSTAIPTLTANDFQCFLNSYAAGCS